VPIEHHFADVNGIRMHYAEAGSGPLVILCHGFPECWYSWRAQIEGLSAAGYRVVAPDQRGYGQTSAPEPIEAYDLCHLTGDIVGLLRHLGGGRASIIGHDWGSPVAWTTALLRPDLFNKVGLLSVPYWERMWGSPRPTDAMRRMCGDDKMFYQLYFQEPGKAEPELEEDPRSTIRRLFIAASGDGVRGQRGSMLFGKDQRWMDIFPEPEKLPAWLAEEDLDYYEQQFRHSGFRGPVNWYRNIDRNSESLAFLAGRLIEQPSIFIAGELDGVIKMYARDYEALEQSMPSLRKKVLLSGAGHWVQQERPGEVNRLLIEFLGNGHA
jgi:pimeloyl-ACP methyl ester carboxylesterase